MINLQIFREYFEDIMQRTPGIHSISVVNVDQDMSDCLKSIKNSQLPALFVVVPSSQETDSDPDNVAEDNLCLIFLMDKADPQRRTAVKVLEDTQPIIEQAKKNMRKDKASGCHIMRKLGKMITSPETGFYTDFCGWSVSFKLETE